MYPILEQTVRTVEVENNTISYVLRRKNVKNINLRVHSDSTISISASPFIPASLIDNFVLQHGKYILKTCENFKHKNQLSNENKKYISGEAFYLLGKLLRLKVAEGNNFVSTDGVYLFLNTTDINNKSLKEKIIKNYFNNYAKLEYEKIVNKIYPIFKKYNIKYPELRIRKMTSRWGSCLYEKHIITLNSELILYPESCIEYVVLHEFCHFIHHNHSKKFYNLLTILMPDWKDRKNVLENFNY